MVDKLTPDRRSKNMQAIRHKDTKPELVIRKLLHRLGYRFRLHAQSLPGKPDVIFSSRRKAVMIHGCFWHGHNCRIARTPRSNQGYWLPKIAGNAARDARNEASLQALGWQVLTVWECEIRETPALSNKLTVFLGPQRAFSTRVASRRALEAERMHKA